MSDQKMSGRLDPVPLGDLDGLVFFGSFNCPFSALAHRRALRLAGPDGLIDWRSVEHDPDVAERGSAVDERAREQFEEELDQIRGLLGDDEPDVFHVPASLIETTRLNVLCASLPPPERGSFRQAVFDSYWCHEEDLNDPSNLERFGVTATGEGGRVAQRWQIEWESFDRRIVPMLRLLDGCMSRGLGTLNRLR